MFQHIIDTIASFVSRHDLEVLIAGSAVTLVLIVLLYLSISRRRKKAGGGASPRKNHLPEISPVLHPTREEILNALVEYDAYPTFSRILSEVFNHFSMEYLNSYGELGASFAKIVDFPRGTGGITPVQKAAMITIVRVLMTSDFILSKCGDTLEESFDEFMQEVSAPAPSPAPAAGGAAGPERP